MDNFEKIIDKIDEFNKELWNGYLFLIDIVDSTKRKIEYKTKWKNQTLAVYALFNDFLDNVSKDINHTSKDNIIVKSVGDACMAFIGMNHSTGKEKNKKCDIADAFKIFKKFVSFREKIHSIDGLCELKLKLVMTYLTEISFVDISEFYPDTKKDKDNGKSDKKFDVMGRGIDFTFRLEKYAGKSHVVINKILYDNIYELADEEWGFIKVLRNMKGWAKEQEFYIVTNDTWLEELKTLNIPFDTDNVDLDLLKHYISKINKQSVDEKKKSINL